MIGNIVTFGKHYFEWAAPSRLRLVFEELAHVAQYQMLGSAFFVRVVREAAWYKLPFTGDVHDVPPALANINSLLAIQMNLTNPNYTLEAISVRFGEIASTQMGKYEGMFQ